MSATATKTSDLDDVRARLAIKTPQDAVVAFLREEIEEDDFREELGRFGTLPGDLATMVRVTVDRPDAAFRRTIPADLMEPVLPPEDSLAVHEKQVAEKQALRDEATELAKKDKTREETVKRETPEFRDELAAKHITDPLADVRKSDKKSGDETRKANA